MIKVNLTNHKSVVAFIKSLPVTFRKVGMMAITEYIIGDETHGLKKEPGYKYVTRKSAYGVTFFTEKQRRWFWANGGPAMIGNNRTHQLRDDWDFTDAGNWKSVRIFNETPGGEWVMGDQQARQPAKVGWRTATSISLSQLPAAIKFAQGRVDAMVNAGKVAGPGSEAFGI